MLAIVALLYQSAAYLKNLTPEDLERTERLLHAGKLLVIGATSFLSIVVICAYYLWHVLTGLGK